jgi:radical SAM protein with 4Fe4S-binding SPASM domain
MNSVAYKILPKTEVLPYRPVTLNALITLRCNLACPICPIAHIHRLNPSYKIAKDMTFKDFYTITNRFSKHAMFTIFSGGEPLLNKELFKMARFASSKRLSTDLTTNGLLIGEHIQEILRYMNSINLSFNAADGREYQIMHNAPPTLFEVLVNNTAKLVEMRTKLKRRLKIALSYVCTKSNFKSIPDFIELAESLGVDEVNFRTLASFGLPGFSENQCVYRDDEEVAEIIHNIRAPRRRMKIWLPKLYERATIERACKMPFSFLTIDGDGNVFPCCIFPSSGGYENIFRSEQIWNSRIFVDLRKRLMDKSLPLPEKCLRCGNRLQKRRIISNG